jgi:hypothetical protein
VEILCLSRFERSSLSVFVNRGLDGCGANSSNALPSVVLPVVRAITPVLFYEVTSVGTVFAVVPVMVIAVVSIVDSHLDAGLLSFGFNHHQSRCNDGSSQE